MPNKSCTYRFKSQWQLNSHFRCKNSELFNYQITNFQLKLFAIVENKQTNQYRPTLSVERLKLPSNSAAYSIVFTTDSSRLIVATLSRDIIIYDVSNPRQITESGKIKPDPLPEGKLYQFISYVVVDKPLALADFDAPIHTLAVSKNNRYLAAGDLYNVTHIYSLKSFEVRIIVTFLMYAEN